MYPLAQWILSFVLILASFGVVLSKKPVHASLFFLLTLLALAALYLQLSAEFIAVMQILVYAGAILVIFMFVIVLFQDAHQQIKDIKAKSYTPFILLAATFFTLGMIYLGTQFQHLPYSTKELSPDYGTARTLGKLLYVDFFFPFEAVILLFLIALVGALYVGRKAIEDR